MTLKTLAALTVTSAAIFAQAPAPTPSQAPLAFEVASIRPSDPIIPNANTRISAGVTINANQFKATYLAFRDYFMMAFDAKPKQVQGPEWITSERFDIQATLPPREGGSFTEKELGVMMKSLLEERFALKVHKETKEFPVYALVQMKDGIKAAVSPLDPEVPNSGVAVGGTGTAQGTVIGFGRGASLSVGGNRIEAKKLTMASIADTLVRFVDRPVIDETGLKETYDISLELAPEDFQALMIRSGIEAGIAMPPQAIALMEKASGDSLHEALAKVGLKLESKKAPLEVVVIDAVNRTPTEN
jgi:uncharacterized protein (TIGR03435 family)